MSVLEWIFGLAANAAMLVIAFAAVVMAYKFKRA